MKQENMYLITGSDGKKIHKSFKVFTLAIYELRERELTNVLFPGYRHSILERQGFRR